MAEMPSGMVTFLFTDIEGSTARWEQQPEAMATALARHDALIGAAIREHSGHVVKTMGDAFHAAFSDARDAVAAAIDAQRRLRAEPWGEIGELRVRMALHTGATDERDGDYYGPPLNRVARLVSAGHGGQVLLSGLTCDLIGHELPETIGLLDLGEHRLKDLIHPEHIFQVTGVDLPSDFPPLRTLNAHPNNLPVHPTELLGREREVAELRGLLERGARLVTLTGPGGTGKTRLSIQVAAELLDHVQDGVYLVDLALIGDPALVPASIARVLDVREAGSRPVLDRLMDELRGKSLVLVLDNFEQIMPAAPVVAELLAASPSLRILVTSREPLRLRGEREYPVSPLSVPPADERATPERVSEYAAVSLFMERAATIRPGFALTSQNASAIAEICTRLDGLPLAIELAAARVRLLTPQAIVGRLERRLPLLTGGTRDLPARQQTLRDTIAWSHDLLDEPERRLFRRLAVFVGGFALDAVEAVCTDAASGEVRGASGAAHSPRIHRPILLDLLESLVAKSLVRQDEPSTSDVRFQMLETIREYALEQMEDSGELPSVRCRHAQFFLALAEEAEPHLTRADSEIWLNRLQIEHDNLRAALAWSLAERQDPGLGLRISAAISWFWHIRSHLWEGQHWIEMATSLHDGSPSAAWAKAVTVSGWLAYDQGDPKRASALFEEGARLYRGTGDRQGLANALGFHGAMVDQLGDFARAEALLGESIELFREVGDMSNVAAKLFNLGNLACAQADFDRASALLEESLVLRRQAGSHTYGFALTYGGLGLVAFYQDEASRASAHFEECLKLFRQIGNTYGIAWTLHYLGRVELLRRDLEHCAALLLESLEMRHDLADKGGIAQCLESLAALAATRHESVRAATLFGAAASLREAIGSHLSPAERPVYERDLMQARALCDEATFAAAWVAGHALTVEQAVAYARAERDAL